MLETIEILTLQQVPGLPKSAVQQLVYHTKSKETIDSMISTYPTLSAVKKLHSLKSHLETSRKKAHTVLEAAKQKGITIIGPQDREFPSTVTTIKNPPVILTIRGDVEILTSMNHVAVVGTRQPSKPAIQFAFTMGQQLAEKNFGVVSGLALGCDTQAHLGCLSVKGKTIAVLAQGLDTPVYPKENKSLAEQIVTNGGCLVSEYLPHIKALPNQFVERNRLQSGLSKGVIIVQSKKVGGTMHTARFCQEQRRLLGCAKYASELMRTEPFLGNQQLLTTKGAKPVQQDKGLDAYLKQLTSPSMASFFKASSKHVSNSTFSHSSERKLENDGQRQLKKRKRNPVSKKQTQLRLEF